MPQVHCYFLIIRMAAKKEDEDEEITRPQTIFNALKNTAKTPWVCQINVNVSFISVLHHKQPYTLLVVGTIS